MANKMLQNLGMKLGITEISILKQASEYIQQMEYGLCATPVSALRLNQTCKIMICLDLAANKLGHQLKDSDKSVAVKLSGMTKKAYLNSVKAVESLLGVQQKCSIKELTVQFGCTDVADIAQKALRRYEIDSVKNSCTDVDFTSILFLTAAVDAACIQSKSKIDRRKLREMCSIKRSVFDRLVKQLQKYIEILKSEKKVVVQKKHRSWIDMIEEKAAELETSPKKQCLEPEKPAVNYEEWKRQILETAMKAECKT